MKAHKRLIHLLIGVSLAIFSPGCQEGSGVTGNETLIPSATIAKESATATAPMLTISQTPNSTVTPVLTATETPGTPRLPPLPTLVPSEATARINELLKTNGGCKFPCWWGITPGETTWNDTYRLLMPLTYYEELLKANVYIWNVESGESFSAGFGFYAGNEKFDQNYIIRDGIVSLVEIRIASYPFHTIPALIDAYGTPEEVWLSTYSVETQGGLPFDILVAYPSKGISAYFHSIDAKIVGDQVQKCFRDETIAVLDLWKPDKGETYEQGTKVIPMFSDMTSFDLFQKLEAATNLTLDSFTKQFAGSDHSLCITTSAKLWKNPFE